MTFKHGRLGELWLNGVDISVFFNSAEFSAKVDTAPVDVFKNTYHAYIVGQMGAALAETADRRAGRHAPPPPAHPCRMHTPVTTRAVDLRRAVRCRLDTRLTRDAVLTSHPLLTPHRRRQNWRIWPFALGQSIGQPAAPSRRSLPS